jgi:predicted MPP superfamily phosphohydrolase
MGLLAEVLLLAAAWFGHAFLMTVCLNWCYAQALPRRFLKHVRLLIAILVFAFPVVLGWTYFGRLREFLSILSTNGGEWPVAAYLWLCWLTTALYVPVISIVRAMRRDPSQVVKREGKVVDIARRLGEKPIGDGKNWRLAKLPWNDIFRVEFGERTFVLNRLPAALDGLTILHLTDLHLCGTPDRQFYREVLDLCMAGGPPDLVAITGDVVDSPFHYRWIVPLLGRLKWTTAAFAILGNHDALFDPVIVRRRLAKLGIQVLGNTWRQVEIRGEPVIVVGQESPWFRPQPDLSKCPSGTLRFCLSHTPDHLGWARQHDIDLMLAGHVHGGQIRLPFIGPLFVPSRYSRRYDSGTFYAPPTLMHVTRGLAGREPLRFNCCPEVVRIMLSCAAAARSGGGRRETGSSPC